MIFQRLTVRLAAAEQRSASNLAQPSIVDGLAARGAPRVRPRHRNRPQARA